MGTGSDEEGLQGGLSSAIDRGATGHSVSGGSSAASWTGVVLSVGLVGCGGGGAGLFFPGAGQSEGGTSAGGVGGFTRDGTGGGGVLETLGRLTSEEDSMEVVLIVKEGAGDPGREDILEGTSGSAQKCGVGGGGLVTES